ncbi:hypothetical protein B0A52_04120 [Exophiala mesophila]|uniref:Mannosyl-oligosaccharide glucosidase n=1 Tax=Exophiala mesophila TaxID=212818 RepID=A0A438NAS6_EXOME|nr:hypothetical protein B0A52_04120 [Exophiala mesophila]
MLSIFLLVAICLYAIPAWSQDVARPSNTSLQWGPYRPNVYFGIRPRTPDSLLMGLMWSNADQASYNGIAKNFRHSCDQDDGALRYEWIQYDARKGGIQVMNDTANHLDLITQFAKGPEAQAPGSWGLKVHGFKRPGARRRQKTTLVFYIAGENKASKIKCKNTGREGIICKGRTPGVGKFTIRLPATSVMSTSSRKVSVYSMKVAIDSVWQAKTIFLNSLKKNKAGGGMISNRPGLGNLHFIQLMLDGDFAFDLTFTSGKDPDMINPNSLIGAVADARYTFESRFESTFSPATPFTNIEHVRFSQSLLSNLLGSLGYFDGTFTVNTEEASSNKQDATPKYWNDALARFSETRIEERGPHTLFSAVPSRTAFARGFLFDEGFHLLTILDWDLDMGVEMISSWLNLIDERGWIPREMILGKEGRNRVPPELQTQNPHLSAPPTMFLAIQSLLDKLKGTVPYDGMPSRHHLSRDLGKAYLKSIYPKLKLHYTWFRQTNAGHPGQPAMPASLSPETYRWQFRTREFAISSGLADYPRLEPPSTDELHVDALAWVGLMAKTLESVATYLSDAEGQEIFSKQSSDVLQSLDKIHWSEKQQMYCDTKMTIGRKGYGGGKEIEHICHRGYVSIMPFLLGLLPAKHPHLGAVLDLMRQPSELWTSHGLRSLSPRDSYYSKGTNIYRGPIWVHFNYLAIKQLLTVAQESGPRQKRARDMYAALRVGLVDTVYRTYAESGWLWEQYHPDTAKGMRARGFVGWNSLLVKIMAMPDLRSASASRVDALDYASLPGAGDDSHLFPLIAISTLLLATYVNRRKVLVLLHRLLRK